MFLLFEGEACSSYLTPYVLPSSYRIMPRGSAIARSPRSKTAVSSPASSPTASPAHQPSPRQSDPSEERRDARPPPRRGVRQWHIQDLQAGRGSFSLPAQDREW